MNLSLTKDEENLVEYACNELAFQHQDQAIAGRKIGSEWAESNEKLAIAYRAIARRIWEYQRGGKLTTPTPLG